MRAWRKFDRGGTRSDIYFSSTEKERLGHGSRGRNKGIAISLTAAPYITSAPLRLLLRSPLFIFPRARSSGPSSLLSIFERFTDNSQYASFHPHSVFQPRSFFFSFFFLFNPLASLALFLSSVSFPFFVLTLTGSRKNGFTLSIPKRENLFFLFILFVYTYIFYSYIYCIRKQVNLLSIYEYVTMNRFCVLLIIFYDFFESSSSSSP